jgi:hypothetical protein
MRHSGAIAAFLLALAACLLAAPVAARASASASAGAGAGADAPTAAGASAQRLLTHVDRLGFELGLPLEDPDPLNLRGVDSISEVEFVNGDGYRIAVLAFGQTVALQVARTGGSRPAATTYLAHGRATPTSIRASFGELGRVDLRFQRSAGPPAAAPFDDCHSGRGPILRVGLFVGSVRFRGEGGYTSARAHRVQGISVDFAALAACLRHSLMAARRAATSPRSPLAALLELTRSGARRAPAAPGAPTHPSKGPRRTILEARSTQPLSRTVFLALARGNRDVRYVAAEATSEGALGVVRLATVEGPRSSFSFNRELSRARVAPPRPFSGTGVFEHGPGSAKSWTGPLSVALLGAPHVSLTGSPFGVQLGQEF